MHLKKLFVAAFLLLVTDQRGLAENMTVFKLETPVPGVDVPKTAQLPSKLADAKILDLGIQRIVVSHEATLDLAVAGKDYPTTAVPPEWAKNGNVLAFDATHRIPIRIEAGKTGLDFPTGGPEAAAKDIKVWIFNTTEGEKRILLGSILKIGRAEAGRDYPTSGSASAKSDAIILTTKFTKLVLK